MDANNCATGTYLPLSPVDMEVLADMVADRVADRLSNRRRLLTRNELSEVIGVSVPKLDTMLRDGELPVIRVGRKVLFDPHAVIRQLAERSTSAEQCEFCKAEPVVHHVPSDRGIVKTCDECWRFVGPSSDKTAGR